MTAAKRSISLVLAFALVLTCALIAAPVAQAAGSDAYTPQTHPNTYVNTGDQRKDIVGVALTQEGYREVGNNNNKYGAALNINYLGWCGAFVSWCAIQAGIPDSVLPKTGVPSPSAFGLSAKYYPAYTPQPGDLFFAHGDSHVGIVYRVEGSSFYSVEGNYSNGVFVAKHNLSEYKYASPNYTVTSNVLYSGSCGSNVTWKLNDLGTLTISGSGAMNDFTFFDGYAPWYPYNSRIKNIVIQNGVTTIGNSAFTDCPATAISLPQSMVSIGRYAFQNCAGLTNITIPNSVKAIGDGAFSRCTGLIDVGIPASVTTIDGYPFFGCSALAGIWVEDGNQHFSNDTFGVLFDRGQTKLIQAPKTLSESYTVPATVTTIGYSAFEGCTMLKELILPTGLTSIEGSAFDGCTRLSSINLPGGLTTIAYYAFSRCASLTSITIPASVTSIQQFAFSGCTGLRVVTLPAGITTIGYHAFADCSSMRTVFYRGDQKAAISFDTGNDAFTGAQWHCAVDATVFAGQDCYYCPECDDCILPGGDSALATVTFLNWDGSTISSAQYHYGDSVTIPTLFPRPVGQVFVGWDKPVAACTDNATYTAVFEEAQVSEGTAGDINGDRFINNDDVLYLLWHTLFGDEYPLATSCDFTDDDLLTNDDVVYLLWHLLFGDEYPID